MPSDAGPCQHGDPRCPGPWPSGEYEGALPCWECVRTREQLPANPAWYP